MVTSASRETSGERKARGAFFTPAAICAFITAWAVRHRDDRVLEPSCGEAAFLAAVGDRLRGLGVEGDGSEHLYVIEQVQGVELHESSALAAAARMVRSRICPTILVGDFFDFEAPGQFDAVVGNPPYVRYQDFSGEARAVARERALALGVPLTGLASSWAAFTVHAASMLRRGGRLGLVLPAELLSVNYAAPVRSFLMRHFGSVRLVMFEERVFPGVSEEVVLLLAEGIGPTDHFTVQQVQDVEDLATIDSVAATWRPTPVEGKWLPALLPPDAVEVYGRLVGSGRFGTLQQWGTTALGMVTGNNRFFALSAPDASMHGLKEGRDLLRISPPGSRHLRGLQFSTEAWSDLVRSGLKGYLFYPSPEQTLSNPAKRYVEDGESARINDAYKCRVRTPWWRVPRVSTPDLFLTYMNHDTPRLVENRARYPHLNSVHGVQLAVPNKTVGRRLLPIAALNSMTLLGAELVGRSYGGGMLKLEPKEADVLPVPSPSVIKAAADSLEALRPRLADTLRGGELAEAVSLVDRVILADTLGLKRTDIKALRSARQAMFGRRAARA